MATSPKPGRTVPSTVARFGGFEVDLRSGELIRNGSKAHLHGQPLQLLELLLQQPGQVVTREQIQQHLWPDGTVVEFEHSVNAAVKRLREALGDDADRPTFIETIPRRGYRFIARVENGARTTSAAVDAHLAPVLRWNKRRFVVTAAVAAFLVVVALATWHIFFARPALTATDVILLASFVNKTGDPIFDNSLDKALEVKLAESPFLSLFPEADVRTTMATMRQDPNQRVTRELGIEICKRQGLKAVVVPEIAAFGSRYLITLEAIDARDQKSIAQQQVEAESKEEVIAALGRAGSKLRRLLGESLSSLEKYDAPLDLATTSSLEALQAYRTGQTLFRSGRQLEAITFFERAIELDPQFCSAYSMLGRAYHNTSDSEASKKNFARAFELKDRHLTQEENFQSTALYHSSITGNLEKASAVLLLYKQAYPRSGFAFNVLGMTYARQGRMEDALQEFRLAIDHSPLPSASSYGNVSQALVALGRFEEAKKIIDQWQQKGSLTPLLRNTRYRIAFIENDAATMERLARETPPDDVRWHSLHRELAFLRGDSGKLRSLSESIVRQHTHAKRPQNAVAELAARAWFESYLGNDALARELCRQAGQAGTDSADKLGNCAKAFANAGDVIQAEALAAKLDRLYPEDTLHQNIYLPVARSIIERKRGNAVKALQLLAPITQGPHLQVLYHRGQAYLAASEPAKAAAEFEELISHRGESGWEVFAPLAQLGLARAYAMQGDRENSLKAYDGFFTTWKNADPDIPILRQAEAEYRKLTATASAAASASAKTQ